MNDQIMANGVSKEERIKMTQAIGMSIDGMDSFFVDLNYNISRRTWILLAVYKNKHDGYEEMVSGIEFYDRDETMPGYWLELINIVVEDLNERKSESAVHGVNV